jgi:hypothetical protein
MGIHDQVGTPSIPFAKWHVDLWNYKADYSFLSMSRREFISDFRYASLSRHHLDDAVLFQIRRQNDSINTDSFFSVPF